MKLSMDTVSYAGYFTDGEHVEIEEAMNRAAKFGFDAIDVFAHRPMGFPMDLDQDRRKRIVDHAGKLDLAMACVECCTNYMRGNHVLVFPQEKEILYTREAIKLAVDLGIPLVRILAGFIGYFMNPLAQSGYGNPAFESRSRRVSQNKDWLEQWHAVKDAFRDRPTQQPVQHGGLAAGADRTGRLAPVCQGRRRRSEQGVGASVVAPHRRHLRGGHLSRAVNRRPGARPPVVITWRMG